MKAVLRKDHYIVAIEVRPETLTNDKRKETDNNVIANMNLALIDSVLSSVAKKMTAKEI